MVSLFSSINFDCTCYEGSARMICMVGSCSGIFATKFAFALLRKDGSVLAWGDPAAGGDYTAVEKELSQSSAKAPTSSEFH